ncbi:MAG: alkane 1-monooxygenase, partial [Deltaproteobacteria bacterium]|nr:alkane 1-monooxygenase [Deltaproteobacteria bacterium]
MSASAAPLETADLNPLETVRIWAKHLVSLYIPALSLTFVLTAPHTWWVAVLFMLPMVWAHHADCSARVERRQPSRSVAAGPFDALVYLLVAIQLAIVAKLVWMFSLGDQGFFSADMVMVFLVVGGSSGFSIITAHELMHRPRKWEQQLGRLLLATVLYEHFYTEHLRGHHVRVGTPDDPATARFGERFEPFFRRTVKSQLRSAWRIETKRLGDVEMGMFDRRQLGNRVLHGLVFEWSVAAAVLALFGFVAFFAFVLQAFMAVRLLEAVNYFEHWGLRRKGDRVQPVDSWDTHGWFTYYGLIGLSRHADHHAYPIRPYQKLRVWEEAPTLPFGYIGTVDQVMANNDEFMRAVTVELGRRRLGPFAPEDAATAEPIGEQEALAALAAAREAETPTERDAVGPLAFLGRLIAKLDRRSGIVLALCTLLLGTAAAVHWETGIGM